MSDTTKHTSGLAIAGLVLGILAATTSFLPFVNNLSFIVALVGFVLALIALIGAVRGRHTSKGMSIAGVTLSVASMVIVLATQSMYGAALDAASQSLHSGEKPVSTSPAPDDATAEAQANAGAQASATDEQAAAEPEQAPATEDPAVAETPAAEDPAPEAPNTQDMPLGQTVTLENGLSLTVVSATRVSKSYSDETALSVSVVYVNNSDETLSFNTYDWKSEDASGVQKHTTYMLDYDDLSSGTLAPGGTVTGNVFFEGEPVKVMYYSNIFQSESAISWRVA